MDLASFPGEPRHAWRRAYLELSGGALVTLQNELRSGLQDFPPPWQQGRNRELLEHTLEELEITRDARHRLTRCRLRAPLGGDRCVLAKLPLPRLHMATVLPQDTWRVAWRSCSYYEVAIQGSEVARATPRSECVSVGLALATIPLRGLCFQQAGWNQHLGATRQVE